MRFLISSNKNSLELINKKINDYMIANVPNYNATQWGRVVKHPTEEKWVLKINDDSRKPLDSITSANKSLLIDKLSSDWESRLDIPK